MTDWDASARAWIDSVDRGDPNRLYVADPAMQAMLGAVTGQTIVDVGCGEGRLCRMLSGQGAETIGIDPTKELLDESNLLNNLKVLCVRSGPIKWPRNSMNCRARRTITFGLLRSSSAQNERAEAEGDGGD